MLRSGIVFSLTILFLTNYSLGSGETATHSSSAPAIQLERKLVETAKMAATESASTDNTVALPDSIVCEVRTVDANLPPTVLKVPLEKNIVPHGGPFEKFEGEGFKVTISTNARTATLTIFTPDQKFSFVAKYVTFKGKKEKNGFTGDLFFELAPAWVRVMCYAVPTLE